MTFERIRDNDYCFACGGQNPLGLHLQFSRDGGMLKATCRPGCHHQGYEGILHGGIVATILDDTMSNLVARVFGAATVTAELTVRLRRPVKVERALIAEAEMADHRGRVFTVRATLKAEGSDEIVAEAESRMVKVSPSKAGSPLPAD